MNIMLQITADVALALWLFHFDIMWIAELYFSQFLMMPDGNIILKSEIILSMYKYMRKYKDLNIIHAGVYILWYGYIEIRRNNIRLSDLFFKQFYLNLFSSCHQWRTNKVKLCTPSNRESNYSRIHYQPHERFVSEI